jgi:hypothetical protein
MGIKRVKIFNNIILCSDTYINIEFLRLHVHSVFQYIIVSNHFTRVQVLVVIFLESEMNYG